MDFGSLGDYLNFVTDRGALTSANILQMMEDEMMKALSVLQSEEESDIVLDHSLILSTLNQKLKALDPRRQLKISYYDFYTASLRYEKLLERSFIPKIARAFPDVEIDVRILDHIIASHLYRECQFDAVACFAWEANEPEAVATKDTFLELLQILEGMESQNMEPALTWVTCNYDHLMQTVPSVVVELHGLQFLQVLKNKGVDEAIKYARSAFAPFASKHMPEIQKFMSFILWAKKLHLSPRSELLSSIHSDRLAWELKRQFCNLKGLSYDSPLSVTVEAGCHEFPAFWRLLKEFPRKQWQNAQEAPFPVDLDNRFVFHSSFVCPVTFAEATESNPPARMPCGHVLCLATIMRLCNNDFAKLFKCPQCTTLIRASKCLKLHL